MRRDGNVTPEEAAEKAGEHQNLIFSLVGGGLSGWIIASMDPISSGIVTGMGSMGVIAYITDNAILSILGGATVGYLTYSLSEDSPALIGLGTGMVTFMGLYKYIFTGGG